MNHCFEKLIEFYLIINKSVFSDNGSTAVEVAIKVTAVFSFNKGENDHNNCFRKCISWRYFAAMAASGISLYKLLRNVY
jgi:adenosylmethionine-8-amino-7-oxononanoate aminotransferase